MRAISNYEFGDGEIRFISFNSDSAVLNVFVPHKMEFARITFENTSLFFMETNCIQNVIESINILSKEDITNRKFTDSLGIISLLGRTSFSSDDIVIYVQPIAGPEIIVSCKSYAIKENLE